MDDFLDDDDDAYLDIREEADDPDEMDEDEEDGWQGNIERGRDA